MKKARNIFAVMMLVTLNLWAGAEHDHGAPTFQAPKGGVLKSTHHNHFELVKNQSSVSVYAYDQEGKAVSTKGFKMSAELEIPRKKSSPLKLTDQGTHWEASVDSQGAHRFTVKILIDDGKEKDYVKFTVEK